MLRPPELREFERRRSRRRNSHATYGDALAVFKALWSEARTLRPDFPAVDWRRDIEPALAIARAVNGLPPAGLREPSRTTHHRSGSSRRAFYETQAIQRAIRVEIGGEQVPLATAVQDAGFA